MLNLTTEEMIAMVEFFGSDAVEDPVFFDENVMSAVKKMADIVGKKLKVIKCSCGDCYNYSVNTYCPSCGAEYDGIEIGTRVEMPYPNYDEGQSWHEEEVCTVTGFEEIEGDPYVVVIGTDNRSWCVLREKVIEVED